MVKRIAKKIRIGVDPSFRDGGFWACMYDRNDNTMDFKRFDDVVHFILWINSDDAPEYAVCVIEDSNLQNFSFDKKGNKSVLSRKSRNVGTNQAVSALTVKYAVKRYGKENVKAVSPKKKGSKLNANYFNRLIEANNITLLSKYRNQDTRDAAKLCLMKIF